MRTFTEQRSLFKFRRDLRDMVSNEELPLFEIKLEDEVFIPNKRVKQMMKEELLQNIEKQKSKNTKRSTKTSLNTWKSWYQISERQEEIPKGRAKRITKTLLLGNKKNEWRRFRAWQQADDSTWT